MEKEQTHKSYVFGKGYKCLKVRNYEIITLILEPDPKVSRLNQQVTSPEIVCTNAF
jgi:hypothetical protein